MSLLLSYDFAKQWLRISNISREQVVCLTQHEARETQSISLNGVA